MNRTAQNYYFGNCLMLPFLRFLIKSLYVVCDHVGHQRKRFIHYPTLFLYLIYILLHWKLLSVIRDNFIVWLIESNWPSPKSLLTIIYEWGWTARIAIARNAFARHFWQQNYCSTQILSFARIQLILAKPDSSKWQKKCHFFLRQ